MSTTPITKTTRGHRIWLQSLTSQGFTGRFDVSFSADVVVITFHTNGKRRMTDAKGGIVDIQSQRVTQWAQGASAAHVDLLPATGTIIISRRSTAQ